VRKTSVYLTEREARLLAAAAAREGRPQAEIIRDAIAAYALASRGDRDFALAGSGEGPGGSIADVPEEELLEGFGG
jgi:hypothetical protein